MSILPRRLHLPLYTLYLRGRLTLSHTSWFYRSPLESRWKSPFLPNFWIVDICKTSILWTLPELAANLYALWNSRIVSSLVSEHLGYWTWPNQSWGNNLLGGPVQAWWAEEVTQTCSFLKGESFKWVHTLRAFSLWWVGSGPFLKCPLGIIPVVSVQNILSFEKMALISSEIITSLASSLH